METGSSLYRIGHLGPSGRPERALLTNSSRFLLDMLHLSPKDGSMHPMQQ